MDLSENALKSLDYDKTKVTIAFVPVVVSGHLTFRMSDSVNRNYAFRDCGQYVIPCVRTRREVSRSTFADMFMYEQTRIAGDYGTYRDVPKTIRKDMLNSFALIPGRYPVFEGYFDSLYAVNRSYTEFVLPTMFNRIMPFERITDKELSDKMRAKDFTEYGLNDDMRNDSDTGDFDEDDFYDGDVDDTDTGDDDE